MLFSVSKYIIDKVPNITNLKLQKLVYISFGFHAGKFDEYIFGERIEAWQYGPVIPILYNKLSSYGRSTVDKDVFSEKTKELSQKQKESVDLTIDIYSKHSAGILVEITHDKGTPWHVSYEEGKNNEIPKQLIKDYYKMAIGASNLLIEYVDTFRFLAKT